MNNADGYTNSNFSTSKGWYWWLRTPYSSGAHRVRYVNSDGSLNNFYAYCGSLAFARFVILNLLSWYLTARTATEIIRYLQFRAFRAAQHYRASNVLQRAEHQHFFARRRPIGRRRADLLFRALIQQRRVDTGSSVRKQDVHGSGIDRVEHVKIPRPRKGHATAIIPHTPQAEILP